ncbi:MAG: nucleotidyl transferase AbiEii/AbiGii toxin family protein [Planctomycetes bacterium]|nr:nucleotidyl transferase AbiEii/AbiGii toxin family protein [Planctomycetota bacterium]
MDEFAKLPGAERRIYFDQAAAKLGLSVQIIEKDYWVCWSLRRLFSLDEFRDHLTFKGGTSLSKVYRVIERFSEDVDVAIERDFLGFGGEKEPEKGASGKEQQRRIAQLKEACQAAVANRLQPQLREAIAASLGTETGWNLSLDSTDPDQQTLLYRYPSAMGGNLSPYIAAAVKIELGARSDHFPVEQSTVAPYLSDAIPDAFSDTRVHVRVLSAARTFWEKATILHMLHHQPEGKRIAPRMSRHYYDVFQLSNSPIWNQSLDEMHLLKRVAIFKETFFKAAWAKYAEARPGTLKLVPKSQIIDMLARDFVAMQPMFFREPPPFDQIMARISEVENRINLDA